MRGEWGDTAHVPREVSHPVAAEEGKLSRLPLRRARHAAFWAAAAAATAAAATVGTAQPSQFTKRDAMTRNALPGLVGCAVRARGRIPPHSPPQPPP
mmetsp:Transcript_73522/g.163350  ORF Transcript_73522/g.163350 Transcript_73522/m.163350 type:complete len:97 (-) Transcript_73522:278-568(-)